MRFNRSLAAAILCTAVLAACAEGPTSTDRASDAAPESTGPCQPSAGQSGNAPPCDGGPQPWQPGTPIFDDVVTELNGTTDGGAKTVHMSVSASFSYATHGRLTASYQKGACGETPAEYLQTTVSGYNAPFGLSNSRSATYPATESHSWAVSATAYAEAPEGGSSSKTRSATLACY